MTFALLNINTYGHFSTFKHRKMYLSRNVIREVEAPKRWILKRQASVVSPVYRKDYSLDNISVHSSDRTPTPQSKSVNENETNDSYSFFFISIRL